MISDIHKCYKTFELEPDASLSDLKLAYRDLAAVWHPDRFTDNPRLQAKAEEKLKQINRCYEILKSHDPPEEPAYPPPKSPEPTTTRNQTKQQPADLCKLSDQLILGDWYQADIETQNILLASVQRQSEGWLGPENIDGLLYEDLRAIDRLWSESSHQLYGFSIQKKIWESLNCQSAFWTPVYKQRFGDALGWRNNGLWIRPENSFNYSLKAPKGCFPRLYIFSLWGWWTYTHGQIGKLRFELERIFLRL